MAEPFLAEIRIFSFLYAPKGWAFCDGQTMPINQNQALFSLLGTMYGGDGIRTFLLPNLQGRVPLHLGNGFVQGQVGGEENHTLSLSELPSHTHVPNCNNTTSNALTPGGNYWGKDTAGDAPYAAAPSSAINAAATNSVGGGQPHNNMAPSLVLNFCIAVLGIFPSRN